MFAEASHGFTISFEDNLAWILVGIFWGAVWILVLAWFISGVRAISRHRHAVESVATAYVEAMNDPTLPLPISTALDSEGSEIRSGAATILDLTCLGAEHPEFNLLVDRVFPDLETALASVKPDGVNPLPGLLLDIGTFPATITRLTYDPVAGMGTKEPLELDGLVHRDALAEYLGHPGR